MAGIERKRFRLRPLSPVHVGSNASITPYEYIIKDNVLYKIDMEAMLKIERVRELIKPKLGNLCELKNTMHVIYTAFLNKGNLNFLGYQIPVTEHIQREYDAGINNPAKIGQQEIFLMPRNPAPYIPASSIKGAIRTAVLNGLAQGRAQVCQKVKNPQSAEYCLLEAQIKKEDGKWQNEFSKDPFQYLRLPDIKVEGMTKVVYVERLSLTKGNSRGIPSMREVWVEGEVEFEISFDGERYARAREGKDNGVKGLEDIFKYVRQFYEEKLEREIERIEKSNLSRKHDVLSELNKVSSMTRNDKKSLALIRIGWGSGYDCVTIEELREQKKPVKAKPGKGWGYSMNIVEQRRPLGWAVLEEV